MAKADINLPREDDPEHIKLFYKNRDKVKAAIGNVEFDLTEAYQEMLKAVDKDRSKLKTEQGKAKAKAAGSAYLVKRGKEYFGAEGGGEKDSQLARAYSGMGTEELGKLLDTHGEDLSHTVFEKERGNAVKNIAGQLSASASDHLKDEHIGDIVTHMQAHQYIDAKHLDRDTAVGLLAAYASEGAITKSLLKEVPKTARKEYEK